MRKKGAKKRGGSRGGRKSGSTPSTSKNDEPVVETATQETQPTQEEAEETEAKVESPTPAKEGENEEVAEENQEEEAAKVEPKPAEEGENEEEAKEDQEEDAAEVEPKPAEEGENEEEAKEDQEEEKEDAKPDSARHQKKDKSASRKDEAKGASSSQPELRRGKRTRAKKTEEAEKKPTPRAKRARTTKSQEPEPEYFKEKRNLEDLWKFAFPVGTEWDQQDTLYDFNWDFTNVEEALEEGGKLYGKEVYVFGCTESHSVPYNNENKDVLVPAVVCVESSIAPSDKIGVASVQGEDEEIIPMKTMKMAWIPYVPLEKRDREVDRMNIQIFTLGCSQRRSALKHLKNDRVQKFNYCCPYINNPFKVDESEQSCQGKVVSLIHLLNHSHLKNSFTPLTKFFNPSNKSLIQISMEKLDRRSEEETYLWIPLQCLDQTIKAILKCLGFHQDSPTTTKTASSLATSNQPEEEEDVITVKEEVVVTSRGIKNGVTVTSRATKAVRPKKKGKERVSSGRPGQHNDIST